MIVAVTAIVLTVITGNEDDSTKALIVFAAFTLVAAMISLPSAQERKHARETLDGAVQ